MAMTRSDLHRLLDAVPDEALSDVQRTLEPLADPFLVSLANAPIDDEPETDDERAAVLEAREDIAAGNVRDWDEVRRDLTGG